MGKCSGYQPVSKSLTLSESGHSTFVLSTIGCYTSLSLSLLLLLLLQTKHYIQHWQWWGWLCQSPASRAASLICRRGLLAGNLNCDPTATPPSSSSPSSSSSIHHHHHQNTDWYWKVDITSLCCQPCGATENIRRRKYTLVGIFMSETITRLQRIFFYFDKLLTKLQKKLAAVTKSMATYKYNFKN